MTPKSRAFVGIGTILGGFLCVSFLVTAAASAQPLEKYVLTSEQIVSIIKKHFRSRTGIDLNYDRTEIVTPQGSGKKYREGISNEDARCFRNTALALEKALMESPGYLDLLKSIAPSITIGSLDNSARTVSDESIRVSMRPSTYVDLTDMPVNTVRIQPLITSQGCSSISPADFDRQLAGWAVQVGLDSGIRPETKTRAKAGSDGRGSSRSLAREARGVKPASSESGSGESGEQR